MAAENAPTHPAYDKEPLTLKILIDGPAGKLKAEIPHESQQQGHQMLSAVLMEYYKGMAAEGIKLPPQRPARSIVVPKAGTVRPSRN